MSRITDILHSIPADPLTGALTVPVYQTSTFLQEAPDVNKGYDYSRTGNPTRAALEKIVAGLEGGSAAFAFATGMAAIDAVAKLLKAGDEIIAVEDIYGGAYRLFTEVYKNFGIKVHFVDTTRAENILDYLNDKTKLIWLETPTNPTLKITELQKVAEIARSTNALVVVDNTFASPVAQRPFELGADIIVHSATKYIGGHSDLVAGIVVTNSPELDDKIKFIQNAAGAVLGPWDCYLAIRGIETIELRVRKQSESALKIAEYLANRPEIDKIYYPGLSSHQNHDIAAKQQDGIFGGVISFSLKDDTIEAATKLVTSTKYFKLAESLGGVKSLICHPFTMTHASIPRENKLKAGIQESLVRLSVGIEDPEDLIQDLSQALHQLKGIKINTEN